MAPRGPALLEDPCREEKSGHGCLLSHSPNPERGHPRNQPSVHLPDTAPDTLPRAQYSREVLGGPLGLRRTGPGLRGAHSPAGERDGN